MQSAVPAEKIYLESSSISKSISRKRPFEVYFEQRILKSKAYDLSVNNKEKNKNKRDSSVQHKHDYNKGIQFLKGDAFQYSKQISIE